MSKIITQKCKVENCGGKGVLDDNGKRYFTRGYCNMHYKRLIRNGSIGCLLPIHLKHGWTKHILYSTYYAMKDRCYNTNNKNYVNYGQRGITVCDRWRVEEGFQGLQNFIEDMGNRPTYKHSIDRIDNNKGYSPDNCRWATWHEQNANRRDNNKIVGVHYNNRTHMYVAELCIDNKTVIAKSFKLYSDAVKCRIEAERKYKIIN